MPGRTPGDVIRSRAKDFDLNTQTEIRHSVLQLKIFGMPSGMTAPLLCVWHSRRGILKIEANHERKEEKTR